MAFLKKTAVFFLFFPSYLNSHHTLNQFRLDLKYSGAERAPLGRGLPSLSSLEPDRFFHSTTSSSEIKVSQV